MSTPDSGSVGRVHRFPPQQQEHAHPDQTRTTPQAPPAIAETGLQASHGHLYAGTVFEHHGTLAQQLLAMLKPQAGNPELFMVDILLEKIAKASRTLRRRARKKDSCCQMAAQILEDEQALRDLLSSYRSALYSG